MIAPSGNGSFPSRKAVIAISLPNWACNCLRLFIAITFLLTTHLRPELKHAPISWWINFLDAENAAVDNY